MTDNPYDSPTPETRAKTPERSTRVVVMDVTVMIGICVSALMILRWLRVFR